MVHSGPEPVGNHDGPRVSHRINLYRIHALIIAEIRGTDDGNLKIVVVSGLGCGHSACMGCEIARGHVFVADGPKFSENQWISMALERWFRL